MYNNYMRTLIVDKKYNEKKLNTFLLENFNGLTMNTLYKALRKKDIKINGKRISENVIVHINDEIQIYISDDFLFKTQSFEALYEDDNIVVFNKPVSLEVTGENSLTSYLKNSGKYQFIEPCHRLDRNTTGLVLYAKNEVALNIILNKFKSHEIEKHYLCTVIGTPKKDSATLCAYLFKDNKKSIVYISDAPKKGYQKILTSYKILETDIKNNLTKLDVELHTGKTHQIRAHLAHIGNPILGDGKYGINEINKKFGKKTQQLCSYKLKFNFTSDSDILNYLAEKEISLS